MVNEHEKFMGLALAQAEKAGQSGEVPVGAILVSENGSVLGAACNQTIARADPTAHAEVLARREAALKIHNYRLLNNTLYVTRASCAWERLCTPGLQQLSLVPGTPDGEPPDHCIILLMING